MKEFYKYLLKIILIFIITLYVLDTIYTYVYYHFSPRSKVHWIKTLKKQNFDYALLGSSRVNHSIIPNLIEKKTGKKRYKFSLFCS